MAEASRLGVKDSFVPIVINGDTPSPGISHEAPLPSPQPSVPFPLKGKDSSEISLELPNGLNTKIGVDGTFLSGGEQQRIVLARAILKDAPIVVLDEATAFADPENEHLIQKALHELRKGKTVLMIAHHLTSVQDADKILVIAQGKIAEEGTHSELIARNGIYNSMWNEYQRTVTWTV